MGHHVIEARNGREALALYAQDPAEVVLTDIVMPEKEGVETIGELRPEASQVENYCDVRRRARERIRLFLDCERHRRGPGAGKALFDRRTEGRG